MGDQTSLFRPKMQGWGYMLSLAVILWAIVFAVIYVSAHVHHRRAEAKAHNARRVASQIGVREQ